MAFCHSSFHSRTGIQSPRSEFGREVLMAVTRFRGFLTSEIPEPWNQATRPETLAHIAAEYGTTADRLVRHTVVEVPDTVLTREWVLWMHSQSPDGYVPPMMVNHADCVASRGSDALLATLVSLQERGRPLPFWAHVWTQRGRPAQV